MDCIEAMALKPSLRSEMTMKTMSSSNNNNHQVLFDDFYYSTVDDFVIDDLLDLSNGDFTEQDGEEENKRGVENDEFNGLVKFNGCDEFEVVPDGDDFSVPIDDLEDLEWVSRVVHDSGPGLTVTVGKGSEKLGTGTKWPKPSSKQGLSVRLLCLPLGVPAKPRTKRSRPAGRVWSLGSPSLSDSSSSSTHSGPSSPTSCLVFYNFGKPPVKKTKKHPVLPLGDQTGLPQILRRCSHCQVQKTPQWRSGPLGAKTLCNACGVRFKSGRLYPEYRPACSPTFSGHIHSNSHRKVLEMRRVKETSILSKKKETSIEPELKEPIVLVGS